MKCAQWFDKRKKEKKGRRRRARNSAPCIRDRLTALSDVHSSSTHSIPSGPPPPPPPTATPLEEVEHVRPPARPLKANSHLAETATAATAAAVMHVEISITLSPSFSSFFSFSSSRDITAANVRSFLCAQDGRTEGHADMG